MRLKDELRQLGDLAHIGIALTQYVQSKSEGQWIKNDGHKWLYLPDDFAGLYIAYKRRKKTLRLYLRCNVSVPEKDREVITLYTGHRYHPYVEITSPKQYGALFRLIDASFALPRRRRRTRWLRDTIRGIETHLHAPDCELVIAKE